MTKKKQTTPKSAEIVPLFGRDEMNLIEFPFGPITQQDAKTFEVEHTVFDSKLKREVDRTMLITGSDAFGLPKPLDDQVLMGMKALTYEAGFQSKKVEFSRYRLCKTLGWPTDGRSYKRLEESFDRIAGTTLKFKDGWWDHGENEWKSKTFHLIEEVELCSRDQFDRARMKTRSGAQPLCSFVWSDTIWKSFADGYIKKLDMAMWRKINSRRKKAVALRLYRILDKRFYRKSYVRFDVAKLCVGTLGVSRDYAPSQMVRIVERAAAWLVECGFLREVRFAIGRSGRQEATFIKADTRELAGRKRTKVSPTPSPNPAMQYFNVLSAEKQAKLLSAALKYGKEEQTAAYRGYQRHMSKNGDAFKSYREQIIIGYLQYRQKQRAAA